jgi:4-aminobutyrate aminotransferase-like enzyme
MTTRQVLALLRKYESPNVTRIAPDGSWPIVWERAKGNYVWDASGKKYLDLTAAFGVAAAGHANPRVVNAAKKQMSRLLHAMGDVHPHAMKARLARELSRITFERWSKYGRGKTIFCNSGFEAVEAAMKTVMLATQKPGVIVFEGAYHGLGYGSLNVTHREHFRSHFSNQLRGFGHFVPFPQFEPAGLGKGALDDLEAQIRHAFNCHEIGGILVEPVQVRGGIHVPPLEFLPMLRRVCDEHKSLLILDEIYTGFGRTGKWFACEHSATVPDIVCVGKALTGGFPLSACIGRANLMDRAWPVSIGEAIHTSTFLGHPVGCAMALAQINEIESKKLVQKSANLGRWLLSALQTLDSPPASKTSKLELKALDEGSSKLKLRARGLGLLAGIEFCLRNKKAATAEAIRVVEDMLREGYILLPEGAHSNVVSFTPPLTITQAQLADCLEALQRVMGR